MAKEKKSLEELIDETKYTIQVWKEYLVKLKEYKKQKSGTTPPGEPPPTPPGVPIKP